MALSFGIFEGQDVIDALIRESHRGAGTAEWMQWLGTLDCFEDPRARDFFFRLLCDSDEPIVLFAAAAASGTQTGARHSLKAFTISF